MKIKLAISSATLIITQNLLLANETTKLDDVQVVTSASGYEQKITEAPASISVISQEDLRKKKYSNLAEAIEDVEGVDVRGGNGKTGGLNINIRGMGSENTLVLIDGKRQNSAGSSTPNGFGETSNNFLPPLAAIERIEVIRGPMSTLYGSDAMGGVVNIITKKVSNEWTGSINVDQTLQESSQFGNSNNLNTYISGPIVKDLLGLSLRGSFYNREASDIKYADGAEVSKRGNSPVEGTNYSIGSKFNLTPVDNHNFYLDLFSSKQRYNNDKSQLGTLDNSSLATKQASGYKDKLRFEREQFTLGHASRFNIGTLESSIMQNTTETIGRTIPGNKIGNIFNAKMPNHIIGNDRELKSTDTVFDTKFITAEFDKNIVTVGGQYWDSKIKDGIATEEFDQKIWALFGEDEISITDSLIFTLGGRYDHHDEFGGNFSPRGYAVYTLNNNWTLKGGVSQGYKAPKVNDLHNGINGAGRQGSTITIGSPDLKPEKSTNYETGVYFSADNGFLANATIFHNQYKDKIETDGNVVISGNPNIPDGTYDQKKNIGKAETQGLEIGTTIPLADSLNLKTNYTYMQSEQKSGKNKGEPFANTPEHSLNSTLDLRITNKLNTWLKGEYRSDRKRFTENYSNLTAENKAIYEQVGNEIKAYELFHLGANYKWNKDLTFSATIYNLFDKDFFTGEKYIYNGETKYINSDTDLEGRRLWLAMNLAF